MTKKNMVCAECDKPASIDEKGNLVRTCEHKDSAVMARMSATVAGKGGCIRA